MDLQAIRAGVAEVLSDIPDVRVVPTIPEALAASGVTTLVVDAGDPYVSYSEGTGRVNKNTVNMRVVVVPPQAEGRIVFSEIDALLSCGTGQLRSIRNVVGENISAAGTACATSVQAARVRTITINTQVFVVGEVDIEITARC